MKIGEIVSLKSHSFFENITDIMISGDPQSLPPLMVITEILFQKQILKEDGNVDDTERVIRDYKCVWYSHKKNEFEDGWFQPILLKPIVSFKNFSISDLLIGNLVALKTQELELSKTKSTAFYDESDKQISGKKSNITSLLSFVSPVMSVIQIVENKKLLKKNERLEISRNVVKCKWYNSKLEKFSECFLPFESLKKIEFVNLDILNKINTAINESTFLSINEKKLKTIIKPIKIVYASGYYSLKSFDYLKNEIVEININELQKFKKIKSYLLVKAPIFDFSKSSKPIGSFKKVIEKAIKKNLYVRIEYKNRNDKFGTRTLKNYKFEEITEEQKKIVYLTGYCLTKKEDRSFNLERIQKIELLNLSFKK